MFRAIFAFDKFLFPLNDFVEGHSTAPQLNLVNKQILDKILQFEVFVNEVDGQLRATHVILRYKPISLAFQAPKCVIKAKDPCLHQISVAYEGFIILDGVLIPEGTPFTQPLFVGIPSVEASPSQPVDKEEEEEEEQEQEKEPEGIVDPSDSQEEFEVFNCLPSPESTLADFVHQREVGTIALDEMGIQRKSKRSLLDLIESQLGKDAFGKSAQP